MANVTFSPRTQTGSTPQIIYLIYRFGRNDKLAYSTTLKVIPAHWNKKTSRVRDVTECKVKDIINNRLNELEAVTEKYIYETKAKGEEITKDNLRAFLDNFTKPPKHNIRTLKGFLNDFIEKAPQRINKQTGVIVSKKTQLGYIRTLKYLTDFETSVKHTYDFKDIGIDFYNKYTSFLQSKKLSVNSIGREIKTLKIILNEAKNNGIELNREFINGCFVITSEESDSVYLDEKELSLLHDLNLSENKRLEKVRDLFLVGAWTGLRFSDFTRITPDNLNTDKKQIRIEQQKTGKQVVIPLHPCILEIWERYNNSLPSEISNQRFNDYIKEVCKLAGITSHEHKAITKGGIRTSQRFEKWELVSSHTARRSFATNLYLSGFPTLSIMQITGHKTEKAFMKYIKVTPDQHAKLLQLHWIDKGHYMRVVR